MANESKCLLLPYTQLEQLEMEHLVSSESKPEERVGSSAICMRVQDSSLKHAIWTQPISMQRSYSS